MKRLSIKIKELNYQKYWTNIPNGKELFDKYWSQRNQNNFYGKIISSFIKRFGEEIIKKQVNMSSFFRTPIELLPRLLEKVDENLTVKAKNSLLASKSSPTIGQAVIPMDTSTESPLTEEEKKKWLTGTEIHLYLR